MTLDEHIAKWQGKPVDTDNAYGFQCMDEMHNYIKEVLRLDYSILAAPIARSVFENFPNANGSQYFDRIYNSLTAVPKDGDIIFWKDPYGYYFNTTTQRWEYAGHVGISKGSNILNITAFEQNNPAGTYCHMQQHFDLYRGCLGWLRFKNPPADPRTQVIADIRSACDEQTTNVSKIARIKYLVSQV